MNPHPRLRGDLVLLERVYRGEQTLLVKDPPNQKYFRFGPLEALVLQAFDGRATPAGIARELEAEGVRVPEAAVQAFARKLGRMGLLERSLAERTTLELERLRAERRRRRRLFRGELLRMRWSIGDPDRFFTRTIPYLRWCFTPGFVAASVALFAVYFAVLGLTWTQFGATVRALYAPAALTPGTVAVLWCSIVVVVGLHELGHGYTCKHFGGEVHEMGFMLVYFEPAFYCNVNDAWSFPELRARLWVTAAGSWVQFLLASLAAIVWWAAVPGTFVSEVAVAVMLIGGVTTIATNMNPLIPLDGYFALSDYLEIPNLRQRAFAHLAWAIKRHVLRLELPEPPAGPRERRVFLLYGALAAAYITSIFVVTAAVVGGWARQLFGGLGVALVSLVVVRTAWKPAREWARSLGLAVRAHRAALRAGSWRRRAAAGGAALLLAGLLLPRWIAVSGTFVATPLRRLALVAPDSGVVAQVLAPEGGVVPAGAPLLRLRDFDLDRARAAQARRVDSLGVAEARARSRGSAGEAERLAAERATAAAELRALDARREALVIRTRSTSAVLTARPETLLGRRVVAGDTLLALGDPDSLEIRIRLRGAGAAQVRPGQRARLVSYAGPGRGVVAPVAGVSAASGFAGDGVEARVRLAAGPGWRAGVTGEAKVLLRRSNLFGALWWGIRRRVRSDLLL